MAEEHDSWLMNTLGVDVDALKQKAGALVSGVASGISQGIQTAETWASGAVQNVENAVETQVAGVSTWVAGTVDDAKKAVQPVTQALAGDDSGKPVPRPMEPDCKPEHGKVPGPKNHIYCGVHGHVLDTDAQQIIAASVAAYVKSGLGKAASDASSTALNAGSSVLNAGNALGSQVMSAETAAWDGTKTAYNAVTGAYDSVAPDPTKMNRDLGQLVDAGEALAKKGSDETVSEYGNVPILGSVVRATAVVDDAMTDAAGGLLKGAGDLASTAENAFVHPIDAAESMGEGVLGIAEHVPTIPGLATTAKGIHGAVDLARGKTDGKYGATWGDLGQNLLSDTQQDPDDPSKRVNTDVEFLADIGGGKKAWEDKPLEAATRTIANIAPMVLGDEGGGGSKPPPEGGLPEGGPPRGGAVDPFAKTQPGLEGPATQVDPSRPPPEPEAPKANPAQAPEQLLQDLRDAAADQKATQDASIKATGEYVRYHAEMPDPARNFAGNPSWDPVVDEALQDQAERAEQANIVQINKLRAAQSAFKAAQDARIAAARRPNG